MVENDVARRIPVGRRNQDSGLRTAPLGIGYRRARRIRTLPACRQRHAPNGNALLTRDTQDDAFIRRIVADVLGMVGDEQHSFLAFPTKLNA
ncbi:hypothetical protein LJR153_001198 [Paenibacillus sp. LjRoot153]|uniref:hypothetical protein n=1 Tax=Paenibacillus sp. LjRoot153 TaxID=3342270 RepID=UPI003ECDCDBF